MRLGYDTFIKEKLKSVLKNLAIQYVKVYEAQSLLFLCVAFLYLSSSLSTARAGSSFIFHINSVPRTAWLLGSCILQQKKKLQ